MRKVDIILGLIFTLFSLCGLLIIVPRQTFSFGDEIGVTPAFFPYVVFGILLGLSLLLILMKLIHPENMSFRFFRAGEGRKCFLASVLLIGTCIALPYFGFLIVGPMIVAAAMLLMGCQNWIAVFAVSLLTPLLLYFVFAYLLGQPLPVGEIFY